MSESRIEKLSAFVKWAAAHVSGDEKGQAQIYLDRLFQAFGQPGSLDVGGEPEFRIRKATEDGGGTSFADFVWKPVVLIEMKKRGEKLTKHYRQAFDYWARLVPNRPRFVVLCNFDEFWIYDFETQMDSPVGQVSLVDLPRNYGPLAFLFPGKEKPVFDNDHVDVTREAADKLALCFRKLIKRGVERQLAQRFILQILVAFFAEDIDLLEKYFVVRLLDDCNDSNNYDLLGGLFVAMNTPGKTPGGRFKGVPYFNGGLFANPARVELTGPEIVLLRGCAKFDWSKVRPEIFGTIFEHSLDKAERHAYGAHFTHPADIMKIVGPTIVEPWRDQIESAKTLKRLGELRERLSRFRVLDPACGSGNFLYIAYRELKRLEARLFERISEFPSRAEPGQMQISYFSAQNFYGMDINPFAVELAKVTMMIARKLAIDELHITEPALPLDNLDLNFRATDALFTTDLIGASIRTPWPHVDVIIGNPPFLGAKKIKPEHGPEYVKRLRALYPEVPGMADYCVYWIRRTHEHLSPCTPADPVAGRAGLVGTQNIRNNQSRVGGLDYVVEDGTIIEAVDNQPWSGEANVHVSIANWIKSQEKTLLPKIRRLWFKIEPSAAMKQLRKRGDGPAAKVFDLNYKEVPHINSALSDQTDVSQAVRLTCNIHPQRVFQGITPGHAAFVLSDTERRHLIGADVTATEIIHPYLIGDEILTGNGAPSRFILDFQQRSILDAQRYTAAFAYVQEKVLPDRQKAAEEGKDENGNMRSHHKQFLERWWKLSWDREEMVAAISHVSRYLVCSRVTKRPIFVFVDSCIRPGDALQSFIFADDYSFGIFQSGAHWLWFITKCSKLKSDFRYTPPSVFDTFPWPQSPNRAQVDAVARAGREVRRIRDATLPKLKGGLRALYRTLELPGLNPLKDAHAALDAAVIAAYGFASKVDLLAQLLALNQEVANRIGGGESVTAPGIPHTYPNPAQLITDDCIRPVHG
jgi:N-6 DNA Methylase